MATTPQKSPIQETLSSIRQAIEKLSPSQGLTHTKSQIPPLLSNESSPVSSDSQFTVESSDENRHMIYSLSSIKEKSPKGDKSLIFQTSENLLRSSHSVSDLTSPRFKYNFNESATKNKENWELQMLLEYEKEKTAKLELKVEERENIIEELTKKQQKIMQELKEAKDNFNNLRNERESYEMQFEKKIYNIKQQHISLENKHEKLQQQYENAQNQLNAKDQQIRNLELERLNNQRLEEDKIKKMEEFEREITRLIREKSNFSKENEELQNTILSQERQIVQMKSSISDMQREIARLNSGKNIKEAEIKTLLEEKDRQIGQLKRENSRKDEEIENLLNKNRVFEEELREMKLHALDDKNHEFVVMKLKDKISALAKENEQLSHDLKHKRKLEEITVFPSDANRSPLRSPKKKKENYHKNNKENSHFSNDSLISEILLNLKIEAASEIIPKIKQIQGASHTNAELIKRISQLIKTCSPPGVFGSEPSAKQVWKWIRRLMEDYVKLKQNMDFDGNKALVNRLTGFLRVTEPNELLNELNGLLADHHAMQLLLDKIAVKLRLSPNSSLREIEEEIDVIL
ncbi:unnamed protein product [Blepharisma stoltei]|uniref:FRIGIDA-like protein n=1 Tax=Blepharisma stoltei TaxID=1481888 RepID=A0AAU9K9E8_9CILI|nr:unnamed protein product [Blepharisma stoltei]